MVDKAQIQPIPEFLQAIRRLAGDLDELESVSKSLANVNEYAKQLKKFDEKFEKCLTDIIQLSQSKIEDFEKAVKKTGELFKSAVDDLNALEASIKELLDKISSLDFPALFDKLAGDLAFSKEKSMMAAENANAARKTIEEIHPKIIESLNKLSSFEIRVKDLEIAATNLSFKVEKTSSELIEKLESRYQEWMDDIEESIAELAAKNKSLWNEAKTGLKQELATLDSRITKKFWILTAFCLLQMVGLIAILLR